MQSNWHVFGPENTIRYWASGAYIELKGHATKSDYKPQRRSYDQHSPSFVLLAALRIGSVVLTGLKCSIAKDTVKLLTISRQRQGLVHSKMAYVPKCSKNKQTNKQNKTNTHTHTKKNPSGKSPRLQPIQFSSVDTVHLSLTERLAGLADCFPC